MNLSSNSRNNLKLKSRADLNIQNSKYIIENINEIESVNKL